MHDATLRLVLLATALTGIPLASIGQSGTIDTNVLSPTGPEASSSLAFDCLARPAVAYFHQSAGEVRYARWNGTSWPHESVAVVNASPADLAFSASCDPVIAYRDLTAGGVVKHAKRLPGAAPSWVVTTVEAKTGAEISLAFDPAGLEGMAYEDDTTDRLRYSHWNGSAWSSGDVPTGAGTVIARSPSLAFDPSGRPHITYYEISPANALKHISYNGTSWDPPTLIETDASYESSLVLHGDPYVSYHNDATNVLRLARKSGGIWSAQDVPTGLGSYIASFTSLAFLPSGYPALTCFDEGPADAVKLVKWNGTSWDAPVIVASGTAEASSLASPSTGGVGVTYYDLVNGNLRIFTMPEPGVAGLLTSALLIAMLGRRAG